VASAPCAPESKKKGLHVAQPIDYFLAVLFAPAALSTAHVAWDRLGKNPEPVLMEGGYRTTNDKVEQEGWRLVTVLKVEA